MTSRITRHRLQVSADLAAFVEDEALPGTGIEAADFWAGFDAMAHDLAPKNRALLAIRDELQAKIDAWHRANGVGDPAAYRAFLRDIGYLVPVPDSVAIDTSGIDSEIAEQAGPQLVVPVMNARYALNAANARWGSLYDALYGTDAIPESDGAEKAGGYNPLRGARVIAFARDMLDRAAPLATGSHASATAYMVEDGRLSVTLGAGLTTLADDKAFVGYTGDPAAPTSVLIRHNGLHLELQFDKNHPIGASDPAGIKDVLTEAALTTIMDCEDSVAAVDAEDKVVVYRHWLGLMKGTLTEEVVKGGKSFIRAMNPDRSYLTPTGGTLTLPGRSLMFIRNVGHLMTNPAILLADGSEIPEGLMDAAITVLIAKHDLSGAGKF
ncbi:MAG: malate synthase G, partial [Zavarzinia sp.]|nr:malate synthase G [Zavarzinia sp.]